MSFVRKVEPKWVDNMVGGPGRVYNRSIIPSNEELYNSGRLFAHNVIEKGSGVGYHVHHGECEFYYVLSGSAEYNDNGNVITISAGDVTYTGDGEGHGLVNNADEPFEMIALILFEKQKTE